jgi:hypothetical protein
MFVWIATIRRGTSAVGLALARGSIASSHGSEIDTPAARRKVRRLSGDFMENSLS